MLLNDHNVKDSYEEFLIQLDRSFVWFQTTIHNANSNEKTSSAKKQIVHERADIITAKIKDRKSTRLNSSHMSESRMPSSA